MPRVYSGLAPTPELILLEAREHRTLPLAALMQSLRASSRGILLSRLDRREEHAAVKARALCFSFAIRMI